MSAGQVQGTGRRDQPIQIGLAVDLPGVDLILQLLNTSRATGVVKDLAMGLADLTEGPPSTNFLFISSFS